MKMDLSDLVEVLRYHSNKESFVLEDNQLIMISNSILPDHSLIILDIFSSEKCQQSLSKLKAIEIYLKQGGHNSYENIINHLLQHSQITNLRIHSEHQETQKDHIIYCLGLIQNVKEYLTHLDVNLSRSSSSLEVLQKVGQCFSGLAEVTHFAFNFSNNPIGKAKELGKFGKQLEQLSKMSKLVEARLDLSNMHMGHANVHSYTQFVINNADTLQLLDLNLENCGIEKKGTESIKKMIQQITKVKEVRLNIANNGLMDLFIKDMLRAYTLSSYQGIQRLDLNLAGNYLSHEVCEFIHSTFVHPSLSNLTHFHLNLNKNKITNKAIEHIGKIIENSPNIQEFSLDVSCSREKFDGIKVLSEYLKRSKSVSQLSLNLKGNQLEISLLQEFISSIENTENKQFSRLMLEIDDYSSQAGSDFNISKSDLVFLNSGPL